MVNTPHGSGHQASAGKLGLINLLGRTMRKGEGGPGGAGSSPSTLRTVEHLSDLAKKNVREKRLENEIEARFESALLLDDV